jgi:hypothetical protein
LQKTGKYFYKLSNFLDISPIEPGGITKLLVYALWGLNALLFLNKDIGFTLEYNDYISSSGQSIQCTVLKKVTTTDLYVEFYTFVKVSNYVVILPYDCELPILDVITLPRDRSPPSQFFS